MPRVKLLAVLLLISTFAITQQTSSAVKDPTAVAIAQRSLAAMGGSLNFQDVQASGTTTVHGDTVTQSSPITLMATGRANVRTTIQKPSGPRVYVTDGSSACINGALAQNTADTQADMYARRIDFIPALSILREYGASNIQVQYAGTDSVTGVTVDVIALSFMPPGTPPGFDGYKATQRLFYIDRNTSFVVKVQFVTVIDSGAAQGPKTEVYLSKYQMVSGFAVPMYQATYADGKLAQELNLSSVAFNNGVPSTTFTMTCGVANAN